VTTKLTLTIDQLALAVFTEEYRHQRTRTDDITLAIRNACATAQRVAELAPEFSFGTPTTAPIPANVKPTTFAGRVAALAAFLTENGFDAFDVLNSGGTDVRTLGIPSRSAIINVWATGSANVQGKPNDSDRAAIVELLRVDGWKVKG